MQKQNIYFTGLLLFTLMVLTVTASVCMSAKGKRVSHYTFGEIVIDGKKYTEDVVLYPDGSIALWPEDLHTMYKSDFTEIINSGVKVIIYGSGETGAAFMPKKIVKLIESKGIELQIFETMDAIELYNKTSEQDLLAIFHLNC